MKVIGTGFSGLIGSRVKQLLEKDFEIQDLSRETGVDITDAAYVEQIFKKSDAPWVWHLAAYTDVQGAETDKELDQDGLAWKINVTATGNLVSLCRKYHKRMLYLSTDYVFDGTQKSPYKETDQPNPLGWYAKTKYEGEKLVLSLGSQGLIVRSANPYRANPTGKRDFVHKMLDRLLASEPVKGASDQLFCPTLIDDLATGIRILVSKTASGIYHLAGTPAISPFAAGKIIAKTYGITEKLIEEAKFADFTLGRAPFPQYAALAVEKVNGLGIYPHSFIQGIAIVKEQEHKL